MKDFDNIGEKFGLDIADLMENNKVLTKLSGDNWYCVEDAIVNFIEDNKEKIYNLLEDKYRKQDVVYELEYLDKPYKNDNVKVEKIKELYLDWLGNDEIWHEYLVNAINDFEGSDDYEG